MAARNIQGGVLLALFISTFRMRGDLMAKQIRNMSELIKAVQHDINSGKTVKNAKGSTLGIVTEAKLKEAAEALKEYLQKWIRNYFDNYSPAIDNRTGQFLDSVMVEVTSTGGKLSSRVYFDDSKSYRDSLWGGSQAYIPATLNDGWQVKSGWHKNIHHFGYFEGARFMEAAVEEAKNDPRFKGINIVMHTDNPW